jgi:hypothetical protein
MTERGDRAISTPVKSSWPLRVTGVKGDPVSPALNAWIKLIKTFSTKPKLCTPTCLLTLSANLSCRQQLSACIDYFYIYKPTYYV